MGKRKVRMNVQAFDAAASRRTLESGGKMAPGSVGFGRQARFATKSAISFSSGSAT
jgi:hypothetical protein